VGGTVAILISTRLPHEAAAPLRLLGVGALLGAVGWALVDPLPPCA
jgi:hypothetical protein